MRTLLRFSGWAAVAAGAAHLIQFLVLGIGGTLVEEEFPDPARAGDSYWFGLAGLATFTVVGLAYLVFFAAATALVDTGRPTALIWRRSMHAAATIGTGAWLFAGANNLAVRGLNATAISEAADGDPTIGAAALAATYVPQTAAVIVGAVTFAGWFIAFGVLGLRAGQFGVGVLIASILAGVIPLLGWIMNLGGVPVIIMFFLVVGPVLLARSRSRVTSEPALVGQ